MDAATKPTASKAKLPASDRGSNDTLWREVRGVVERITFHNPDTGFARLAPERRDPTAAASAGADRLVTVVGTLPDLQPGEAIIADGWWTQDPKHGWQFQAIRYRTTLPATVQGMKRYRGFSLVNGVGPIMAGRIVDAFDATFDVIDAAVQGLRRQARGSKSIPPMSSVLPGIAGAAWVSGLSEISASVVKIMPTIDAAFSTAGRVAFAGSMTPAAPVRR